MKKNNQQEPIDDHDHELIKAAAQAWHAHRSSSRPAATSEFDARRLNFKARPTRFAAEAIRKTSTTKNGAIISSSGNNKWDFGESLWDYYEIVTVAKKLEVGLMMDHPFTSSLDEPIRVGKKVHKESKTSLRTLFSKMSSKRFSGDDVSPH